MWSACKWICERKFLTSYATYGLGCRDSFLKVSVKLSGYSSFHVPIPAGWKAQRSHDPLLAFLLRKRDRLRRPLRPSVKARVRKISESRSFCECSGVHISNEHAEALLTLVSTCGRIAKAIVQTGLNAVTFDFCFSS